MDLQLKSAGNVQIDNRNGDITIGVPEKLGFKVEARTRGSEVSSDFSELQPKNDDNQGSLSGTPEPPAPPKGPSGRHVPLPPSPPKAPSDSSSAPTEN